MSLRALILNNFWLKLFSVLLATLIWFAIHFGIANDFRIPQNPITNPTVTQFLRLPIRVLTQPGDSRVFKVDPDEVIVTVTGEGAVLRDLTPKTIAAYVDLANSRSARETNQQIKLNIPGGVTVVNFAPRAVNVEQVSP